MKSWKQNQNKSKRILKNYFSSLILLKADKRTQIRLKSSNSHAGFIFLKVTPETVVSTRFSYTIC